MSGAIPDRDRNQPVRGKASCEFGERVSRPAGLDDHAVGKEAAFDLRAQGIEKGLAEPRIREAVIGAAEMGDATARLPERRFACDRRMDRRHDPQQGAFAARKRFIQMFVPLKR
jgi:hypothetical protein